MEETILVADIEPTTETVVKKKRGWALHGRPKGVKDRRKRVKRADKCSEEEIRASRVRDDFDLLLSDARIER